MEIDKHTTILENWSLVDLKPNCPHSGPRIRIGAYCTILHDFQCNAAQSVEIHDHVLIAPRVFITDSDHVVSSNTASARSWTEFKSARVVIEAGCWLGVNCVILKGVRIGHHSIVGANAVITKNVPPWSTVVGIPGHVVEHRMRPDYPPENLIPSLNNP